MYSVFNLSLTIFTDRCAQFTFTDSLAVGYTYTKRGLLQRKRSRAVCQWKILITLKNRCRNLE